MFIRISDGLEESRVCLENMVLRDAMQYCKVYLGWVSQASGAELH